MSGGPSVEVLKKAQRWCVRQFAKRYERNSHASFLAAEILKEADAKFALESHGVEGWTDALGTYGIDYLNMGDSYTTTLLARTAPRAARFQVASWADFVPVE